MSKQFDKFDLYIKKLISVAINDHIGKKKTERRKNIKHSFTSKWKTDMASHNAKFMVI